MGPHRDERANPHCLWQLAGYNRAFRDVVAQLKEEQLATRPTHNGGRFGQHWHAACQRVFAFCDLLGGLAPRHPCFPRQI